MEQYLRADDKIRTANFPYLAENVLEHRILFIFFPNAIALVPSNSFKNFKIKELIYEKLYRAFEKYLQLESQCRFIDQDPRWFDGPSFTENYSSIRNAVRSHVHPCHNIKSLYLV